MMNFRMKKMMAVSVTAAMVLGVAAVPVSAKAKTVKIALDSNVAPFTYLDEDGNLAGFDGRGMRTSDADLVYCGGFVHAYISDPDGRRDLRM